MNEDDREMLFGMAEELAGYAVTDYDREDFQDSPTIDELARVTAMMGAEGREVPPIILEALKATEAGRPLWRSPRCGDRFGQWRSFAGVYRTPSAGL